MRIKQSVILVALLAGVGAPAEAQPLSAIDWLTDSVALPPGTASVDPEVTTGTEIEVIQVRALGAPSIDGQGLIDADVAGLPHDLWGPSDVPRLVRLIGRERVDALPAVRDLLMQLLLVRTDPPETATEDGVLFLARVDKLLELGALAAAGQMLEAVDLSDPRLFKRWFDIRLLLGTEDAACDRLAASPDLAPTFPTRIFCLARGGDWDAAALSLDTAEALGVITPEEDALLLRFLDESAAQENGALPRPTRVTPLAFRLYEAVGEPIPTDALPRAFAHADLRPINGWKAQLSAAERLASVGAIGTDQMFALYTRQRPSASGGVWDRAEAVQAFSAALASGDGASIAEALAPAWQAMQVAELEVPFSEKYAAVLARAGLTGPEASLAAKIGLLSPDFRTNVSVIEAGDRDLIFLTALARGTPGSAAASKTLEGLVQQGFAGNKLPPALQVLIDDGRTGEAILQATLHFSDGALGDPEDLINALRLLRVLGLEHTARRAALELLILERRG